MKRGTMWTKEEKQLFDDATHAIGVADYGRGLAIAKQLLESVIDDSCKHAYVLGCKVAVALRHLGHEEEAREAFQAAYEQALGACQPVIASYIRNDQASTESGDAAVEMIKRAIHLCLKAKESPDSARHLVADRAYMQANLARTIMRQHGYCKEVNTMRRARRTLTRFRCTHPHYESAYLVVLAWELEMPRASLASALFGRAWTLSILTVEIIRQRKVRDVAKTLMSRTRRARIHP